jgi:hypothetical protein
VRPSTIAKQRANSVIGQEDGPQAVPRRPPQPSRNPLWKRRTAAVSRWLHVYLSMVSFAIVFFFAVTGLTLNHQQWFAKQQKTVQYKGTVELRWVKGNVAKLEIVEALRSRHKISSAVSEFRVDNGQVSVSFKGPGYSADVFVDRATGSYDVTETRMGLAAVLNDLHKGRHSGRAWSWVIDVSAVFMTVVSLSGIVLLCFLQKRRFSGFIASGVGLVLCYGVYRLWVP